MMAFQVYCMSDRRMVFGDPAVDFGTAETIVESGKHSTSHPIFRLFQRLMVIWNALVIPLSMKEGWLLSTWY